MKFDSVQQCRSCFTVRKMWESYPMSIPRAASKVYQVLNGDWAACRAAVPVLGWLCPPRSAQPPPEDPEPFPGCLVVQVTEENRCPAEFPKASVGCVCGSAFAEWESGLRPQGKKRCVETSSCYNSSRKQWGLGGRCGLFSPQKVRSSAWKPEDFFYKSCCSPRATMAALGTCQVVLPSWWLCVYFVVFLKETKQPTFCCSCEWREKL